MSANQYNKSALISRTLMSAIVGLSLFSATKVLAEERGGFPLIYPKHAYEPVITESKALSIPIGEKFGFELAEYKNPTPVDMFELSFFSQHDFAAHSINDFSYAKPLIFRITLKGYSLFDTVTSDSNYFAFDKGLESEIRQPRFQLSLTQHF